MKGDFFVKKDRIKFGLQKQVCEFFNSIIATTDIPMDLNNRYCISIKLIPAKDSAYFHERFVESFRRADGRYVYDGCFWESYKLVDKLNEDYIALKIEITPIEKEFIEPLKWVENKE